MSRVAVAVLMFAAVSLAACGGDEPEQVAFAVPEWAKVAPEQIAEAKKHGVPVAFENDLGMRFVLIPAGTFLMGSPEDDEERWDDEAQHEVVLTDPFYLQTTEVTNAQYRRFRPSHTSGTCRGYDLDGDDQPVVEVTWTHAAQMATWLSARDAERTYRLPTDAQWERSCRAGTTTSYWWGDDWADGHLCANANDAVTNRYFGLSGEVWPHDDGRRATAPVASLRANPWGLHDMAGNVWEYCADVMEDHLDHPVTDPLVQPDEDFELYVVRGGGWRSSPHFCRSAGRCGAPPVVGRDSMTGFRLVSPLPE